VDGCFWHRCPTHRTEPKTNAEWWAAKLDRNVARDRETDSALESHGWMVIRIWEHEDPAQAAERICRAVRDRRGTFEHATRRLMSEATHTVNATERKQSTGPRRSS
jgi:DNA mismatch endonuclease (patch repair protein)